MAKNNYYACKDGKIFDSWEECKKHTNGKNIQFKGFKLKSDAEEFAGLTVSSSLPKLDTTPIINPNQQYTHTTPCMSIDEHCKKYNFNNFTEEQRSAVATTDGKALLFAVPGSGKTTVIVARTGFLVHACKVNPKEIVTLTFTKAAAEEMENRYYDNFPADKGLVNFRTIHSFCWKIILPELRKAGFKYPQNLIGGTNQKYIEDNKITQIKIIKQVLRECGVSKVNDEVAQNKVINAITGVKNNINFPEDLGIVTIHKRPIKVSDIYTCYQKQLEKESVLDFDDMLRYSYIGLREYPNVLFKLQERYKYWSIDESQDNSELQYELIKMLVGEKGNFYMVGDDDQSIYSFRAAKPSLMFEKFGTQKDVKKLQMNTNFRSDKVIVNASKLFISLNQRRELKEMKYRKEAATGKFNIGVNFSNEHAEYDYIVKEAKKAIEENTSLAVLYHFNTSSLPIITYLHKNNISYKSSKSITDVLSGLTVSQVMAYLKCSQNQKDFKTVYDNLNGLGIYLDKEKYSKNIIKSACEEHPENTVLENILLLLDKDSSNLEKVTLSDGILKEIEKQKPSVALANVFWKTGILGSDSISDRLKGYSLLSSAELFETINEFLTVIEEIEKKEKHIIVQENSDLHEEDESVCTSDKPLIYLSTIHSAKGKQYDRVMIVDCFDEVIPGRPQTDNINYDSEEERRLFYVAVTRAKHQLDILTIDKYHDNPEPASRFIFDLAMICKKLNIPTQSDLNESKAANSTPLAFEKKESTEIEQKQFFKFSNIFISYSSKEYNIADKVKMALEGYGAKCWMAPKSIAPGSNYTQEIPIAINKSDAVVLILSKSAQESKWVPKEIDTAINKGKIIIPFQIDNEKINDQFTFMLSQYQRIDAYNRLSNAFEELMLKLR